MYLNEIKIRDVRGIQQFKLKFPTGKEAGWHVLLGDNGSGKSTIIRAISMALIGPDEYLRLNPNLQDWIREDAKSSEIECAIRRHEEDQASGKGKAISTSYKGSLKFRLWIEKDEEDGRLKLKDESLTAGYQPNRYQWGVGSGWFSCAFGPFRRFTGGNPSLESIYFRNPRLGAHLTAFQEDAALTESVVWLKDVYTRWLEKKDRVWDTIYQGIKHFINNKEGLLPAGYSFLELTADGPIFIAPGGIKIRLYQLSEGIKSNLSLVFEMLRIMIIAYSADKVFANLADADPDNDFIPVPGVVLIDEIDAHLHPTWQTRIGQWFTKNFPNVQFIVTTHSPLICRAAENGTIWRLTAPGSSLKSGQVKGVERDHLIYGDVLDAYETDNFGDGISRGAEGQEKQARYRELVLKNRYGVEMNEDETAEFTHLKSIFQSNVGLEA